MAGRRVGRLGCALKYQTENKRHVPTEASPSPAEDEATAGSSSQELREGQMSSQRANSARCSSQNPSPPPRGPVPLYDARRCPGLGEEAECPAAPWVLICKSCKKSLQETSKISGGHMPMIVGRALEWGKNTTSKFFVMSMPLSTWSLGRQKKF